MVLEEASKSTVLVSTWSCFEACLEINDFGKQTVLNQPQIRRFCGDLVLRGPQATSLNNFGIAIDTDIKAKRNNIISELIAIRSTKAKAKVKFGVKYLCKHECERSSVPININTRAKETEHSGGICFTLICVATVARPNYNYTYAYPFQYCELEV